MRFRVVTTVLRLAAAGCALVVASACGSSPASPSTTLPTGFTFTIEEAPAAIVLLATLNNQNYTTSTFASRELPPGTYTLTGDFVPPGQASGEGVTFGFRSNPSVFSGGVRAGSLVSVSGPVAAASNCQISYFTPVATTATQVFSLRFEVIAGNTGVCP